VHSEVPEVFQKKGFRHEAEICEKKVNKELMYKFPKSASEYSIVKKFTPVI
jgi:hypothetical protein